MDEESKVHGLLEYASAILAPEHFIVEVTSGLWKYVTMRGLPIDEAAERLEVALEMVFTYRGVPALAEESPSFDDDSRVLRRAPARDQSGLLHRQHRRQRRLRDGGGTAQLD